MKVALIGLALEYYELRSPCLALYNLKMFSLADPDLPGRLVFSLHDISVTQDDDAILARLLADAPDVIGLSCYVWSSPRLLGIAGRLVEQRPQTKIFLGGPDASPRAERLLLRHPFLAGVVAGEGEEAFRLLLRRLAGIDAGDWRESPGLVVLRGEEVVFNPRPDPIDLDRLPIALEDEDFRREHGVWLFMETSRGCRYRCAYCNFTSLEYGWRMRSLESLFRAIDAVAAQGGRFVSFLDAGFNQNLERFRAVVEYLERSPSLAFDGLEINLEGMEEDDIVRLARITSGSIGIGLQTTHAPALRAIGRGYRPEIFRDRTACLHRNGLDFNIDLICGLPADSLASFLQSVDDAYALHPTLVIIFRLQILPGTRLEREAERWGLRFDPEPPYLVTGNSTFPEQDLEQAIKVVHASVIVETRAVNTHAFQLAARELGKRPSELLQAFIRGEWRGAPLSMEALLWLKEPAHIEEAIAAVDAFFQHQCAACGGGEMPVALRDLFALQFATGRLNCTALPERGTPPGGPLSDDMKIQPSPLAALLFVQTDLLRLQRERCPLSEAAAAPHYLLLHRRGKTKVLSRVPKAIAELILKARGGIRVGALLDEVASSFPAEQSEVLRLQLKEGLAKLVQRGVLLVQ